jgi:uncharacterized protein YjiK
VSSFTLGAPPVADDFEGIATAGARIFLITSAGRLYETREGADGGAVAFTRRDTGLGARCELEGLAYDASSRMLLIGCKRPRAAAVAASVTLFRWSIDRMSLGTPATVSIPVSAAGFHPAGVERDPVTGHYVLVAARERRLLEVDARGAVVATRALPRRLHRQPEGLTFLGDSAILIADEGADGRATLTRYPRAPRR